MNRINSFFFKFLSNPSLHLILYLSLNCNKQNMWIYYWRKTILGIHPSLLHWVIHMLHSHISFKCIYNAWLLKWAACLKFVGLTKPHRFKNSTQKFTPMLRLLKWVFNLISLIFLLILGLESTIFIDKK